MITNRDFHTTAEITAEQGKAVLDFLNALFTGSLEEYWNALAVQDQMAVFAHYTYIKSTPLNDYDDFDDYLEHERDDDRQDFAKLKDNCGFSHTVRYSEDGDAYVYLFEKVIGEVHFIAPSPEAMFPLRLTAQTQYVKEQNGYTIHWKVRLVDLDLKNALS